MGGAVRRWWDDPARPPNLALLVGVLTALAAGTFFGVVVGADDSSSTGGDSATAVSLAAAEAPASTTTAAPRSETTVTTAAPAPTTPSRPGSESERQWIAVLASVPSSTPAGEADARHGAIVGRFPDARRLNSSDWASLRPGYWVSYVGPFPTGDAALGFCHGNGLPVPSQCYGRFVSTDPAHQDRIAD